MVAGSGGKYFVITYPSTFWVLTTRFACALLMHLSLLRVAKNALSMMKYACNHSSEFTAPYCAYLLGFMQLSGGLIAEVGATFYMASLDS
jgi:hypothetical protein